MRAPILLLLSSLLCAAPAAAAFNPFETAGIDRKSDAQVPLAIPFIDQHGAPATLAGIAHDRPILLVPLLHKCPNICGVTLSGLMEAIRVQDYKPGRDFEIIAFSIDPKEVPQDARDSLADLQRRYPALSASVHALTGSRKDIAAVTDALGYRYGWDDAIGQYAHIAATAVLTADGRLSRWLYGLQPAPEDLALALTEAGHGRIGTWGDQLLLLCYHYDPVTGRYSPIIWTALRLAGVATAGIMLGGLGLALLRERRGRKERGDA